MEIISKIDRTQLIRIITNLVKNAIQFHTEHQEDKKVFKRKKKRNEQCID
jgi:signal transduction histidine kinase